METETVGWFHRPLESPRLYNAVQRVIGAGDKRLDDVYARGFGRSVGRVLDVGCGPVQETPLPRGLLIGLDVNPDYVARYAAAEDAPTCGIAAVVASAAALPFAAGTFDECRCSAVLHHLPDGSVRRCLDEMRRVLKPGGRIAIFDMVRPARFRDAPLAWIVCALDRGRHVRTADALSAIVTDRGRETWRVETFEYAGPSLHGILMTLEPEAAPS